MLAGDQDDVAAAAAIAAAGAAARNVLLPPEREAAVAAVAGLYGILTSSINMESKLDRPNTRKPPGGPVAGGSFD